MEADRLLSEIAGTVCPADPRTRNTLRADGLMALLHGESVLVCRCGGSDCPTRNVVPTPRRGYLAQILIDVHTLLGLSGSPVRLGDRTPIDPELARTLARDATWQAILTELRDTAHQFTSTPDTDNARVETTADAADADAAVFADADGECVATTAADVEIPDDLATPDSLPAHDDLSAREPVPAPAGMPGFWARCVARGTSRPAGVVGAAWLCPDRPVSLLGAGDRIAAVLAAVAADPVLCAGIDPTGHGGHTTPPAGAVNYRPSRETAALVRAMYPTCVFPGCAVSSAACELDHRVAFDHDDPAAGGWTIPENLQPLCKRDHDIKTRRLWVCVLLDGGVILWTSPNGRYRVTLPSTDVAVGRPAPPERDPVEYADHPVHGVPYTDDELLFEPTWWERFIGDTACGPPVSDPYLLGQYRQHQAIQRRRYQLQPAPF